MSLMSMIKKKTHETRSAVAVMQSLWGGQHDARFRDATRYQMVLDIRKEYVIDSGASNLAHEEAEKLAVRTIHEFIFQDIKPLLNEVQAAIYASDGQKAIHLINEMRQRMSYPELFRD